MNDTGYRLTSGYQFNYNWGFEASYVDLGQAAYSETILPDGTSTSQVKTHGWVLAGTVTYPFSDTWAVTGRLGAIDAHVELDTQSIYFLGNIPTVTTTNWRMTFGASLNWSLAHNWTVRLNWDRYRSLGDDQSTGESSVNLATVGVVYDFQ